MLKHPLVRRAINVVGALACLAAVGMLAHRAVALRAALGEALTRITPSQFVVALLIYLLGGLLLGLGWVGLVRLTIDRPMRALPLLVGHLQAQLAKYLPGNVFHLAWRHGAARREGAEHRMLGLALLLETLLLLAAAAILVLGVVADPRLRTFAPWTRHVVWLAPAIAMLVWATLGIAGRRFGAGQLALGRAGRYFCGVLAAYAGMFVCSAIALRTLSPDAVALPFVAWCGWLTLAWVIGYVTPGAPGGLGLREATLALGLAPVFGEADALALALVYRLLTVVADAVLALAGFLLRCRTS